MSRGRANRRLAVIMISVAAFMLAHCFAAVPLYSRFCRQTGYGGTTARATAPASKILDRTITVDFDASVNPQLPWRFKPNQHSVTVRVGESTLVTYHAQNLGAAPVVGTATYNVQPDKAGRYFTKIQCFCFTRQELTPGQSADLPVVFYIDPKIADDPDMADVNTSTLSYTFFKADSQALDKAAEAEGK